MSHPNSADIELYQSVVGDIPIVTGACFAKGTDSVVVSLQRKDFTLSSEKVKSDLVLHKDPSQESFQYVHSTVIGSDAPARYTSPSGGKTLLVRKSGLEVVDNITGRVLLRQDTTKVHGKVYGGVPFGSPSWSFDESSVVYAAEKKVDAKKGYFGESWSETKDDSDEKKDKEPQPDKFEHREDWGEQLTGVCSPCLFEVSLVSSSVEQVPTDVNTTHSLGQPVYAIDGGVVCVAWENSGRRLGLIYYNSRPNSLLYISPDKKTTTQLASNASYPSFNIDGTILSFYGPNEDMLCHYATLQLYTLPFAAFDIPKPHLLVDSGAHGDIPGLYPSGARCKKQWVSKEYMIGTYDVRTHRRVLFIHAQSATMIPLQAPQDASCTLRDVSAADETGAFALLVTISAPNLPNELYRVTGTLQDKALTGVSWTLVWKSEPTDTIGQKLLSQIHALTVEVLTCGTENDCFYAIHVGNATKGAPVVVMPHGGPHSNITCDFNPSLAYFLLQGLQVLLVNYRGSTGYGHKQLLSLPGKCGRQDVDDCVTATETLLQSLAVKPSKLFVMGGSHGGFLTTHLIGQYPDMFAGAVARNPVCNLVAMLNSTDIPDWVQYEGGQVNSYAQLDTHYVSPDYNALMTKSPMAHVTKVKTPLLMCLGLCDRRVPPAQARDYFRCVPCKDKKLLQYPIAQHALDDSLEIESDHYISAVLWFKQRV